MRGEAERVARALESVNWPPSVKYAVCTLAQDPSGEDIVDVRVIVTNRAPSSANWRQMRANLRRQVRNALEKQRIDRWAYVHFRTEAEEEEEEEADAVEIVIAHG